MARGWESKAVADQMEDAEVRGPAEVRTGEDSPVLRARRERLEALRLSRARTLSQLENARTTAHRTMLERAISSLDQEIKDLT